MADEFDFSDRASIRRLLDGQLQSVSLLIAARCALRALPNMVGLFQTGTAAFDPQESILPFFRASITASVAAVREAEDVLRAARSADFASRSGDFASLSTAFSSSGDTASYAAGSASSAARLAANVGTTASIAAVDAVDDSTSSMAHSVPYSVRSAAYSAAYVALTYDAHASVNGSEYVFTTPLWPGGTEPQQIIENWNRLRGILRDLNPDWQVWIDIYEGFRNGTPFDWDLLTQIALIPDEYWRRGPRHVNARIEALKAEKLPDAISVLREVLEKKRLGIGGNFPPPDKTADDYRIFEIAVRLDCLRQDLDGLDKKFQSLAETLDALRVEPQRNSPPDLGLLKKSEKEIKAWASWCREKADLTVNETIKWGVPLGLAQIGGFLETLASLIARVIQLLPH